VSRPQVQSFISEFTDRPMTTEEGVLSSVAKNVVDIEAGEDALV
jgi:hypothetical protein